MRKGLGAWQGVTLAWMALATVQGCTSSTSDLTSAANRESTRPAGQPTPQEWRSQLVLEVPLGPFGDGASDLNGDGVPDIVVSNRALHRDLRGGERENSVTAISVRTGAEIQRWGGGAGFGYRVALGGDADADGCGDVLVTTGDIHRSAESKLGVLSGRTGDRLLEHAGTNQADDIAWLGDLDGDGLTDYGFTIAECLSDERLPPCGRHHGSFGLECRSGRTGNLLSRHARSSDSYESGLGAIESIGDVDLDGTPDVLAVLPRLSANCSDASLVVVLSGATGECLDEFPELGVSLEAHEAISAAGDVDGNGAPDFLVGSYNSSLDVPGGASLVDTASHRVLHRWVGSYPHDAFGWAVAGLGDATGDGVPDIAIGAPAFGEWRGGFVSMFSGSDGTLLAEVLGEADSMGFTSGSKLGICVRRAGDVDGDGRAEVLIGKTRSYGTASPPPDTMQVVGLAPR
jgi:FG-GAP repeat